MASDIQVGGESPTLRVNLNCVLPVGSYVINFNYVNFEERVIDLEIYADGSVKIEMKKRPP